MSKNKLRALVGVLSVATIGVAGSGCRQDSESEPEPSRIGIQEEHEQRKADLAVQFSGRLQPGLRSTGSLRPDAVDQAV